MAYVNPSNVNPYETPKAAVAEAAEEFQPVKLFSVSGRIGQQQTQKR